ncbi:MAG: MFS transporter [Acidobacteria bacterium]|nr:MFS transporter [Acidobacteriota bacterium]
MNTLNLPALVDNRILRLLAFAGLYVAQGLPYGLFIVALPTWFAAKDYSSTEVGLFIAVVSLPWTLKLLAGPIMDRFSFLSMGRRRPWVLTAQTGILFGCLMLSTGINDFYWLLGLGFFINFCAAWQDVAVDGMAIDILPENERARANAFMFGGQMAGISGASAGGAWLLSGYGLGSAFFVMSLCVVLIMLIPLLLRERRGEKLLPWTKGEALQRSVALQETKWKKIFGDLFRTLFLPMSVLLIVVDFGERMTSGILQTVFPVLTTQELGFSDTFYPEWTAVAGIIAAVFCIVMSPIIDRMTPLRAIYGGLIFKVFTVGIAALLVSCWSKPFIMTGIIFSFEFYTLWLTIATVSLFMTLCASRVAASQFAIYMALSNLALSAGAGLTGPLDKLLDFHQIFYVVTLFNLAMIGCLLFFNLDKHKARLKIIFASGGNDTRAGAPYR